MKSEASKSCVALALVSTLLPLQANSANHQGPLQMVYPQGDGSFVLGFVPIAGSLNACSSAAGVKYTFVQVGQNGVNADGIKNMLATALTAFALGKSVGISYSDASSSCFVANLLVED
jgi:hypothetical protein